ncbi:MAG: F0F1 ATP synthase subunit B [Telmatospirillum sp.]|nr:F0F1 ATP synthase subunit B [Telmatospirillum sp.]
MFVTIAQAAEAAGAHAEHGGFFSEAETWVAITWLIVVALLARPVFRGITAALALRREKIRARIEEAERLRAEAQEMLATYQKKQRDALKEAEAIIANAKAEAQRLSQQAEADLDDLLKRREQQAVERIAQAESEALREVRNQAIDIAIGASRRLISDTLSAEQASALVDAAITDLPNRLH